MSLSSKRAVCFFVLVCISLLLPQCAHICGSGLYCGSSSLSQKEIERLNEITKNHPDPDARARSHLRLAAYYSAHKNANYLSALKELEAYAALDPEGSKRESIQNWLALLRELERTKNKLKESKESLEQLKKLDIKMEEMRKKIK